MVLVGGIGVFFPGPDGYAWIAYYDEVATALKFADCENVTCSIVDVVTIDGDADGVEVGSHVVLINLEDHPLIIYLDAANIQLKTAYGS